MAKMRKFGGKTYELRAVVGTKQQAEAGAKFARQWGKKVRLVKRADGQYECYTRRG